VGPKAGLDDVKDRKFMTLPGLEFRPFGRPAHSHGDLYTAEVKDCGAVYPLFHASSWLGA
jgi:hypothetical protein